MYFTSQKEKKVDTVKRNMSRTGQKQQLVTLQVPSVLHHHFGSSDEQSVYQNQIHHHTATVPLK